MDTVAKYRKIIHRILDDYLAYIPSQEHIETLAICDDVNRHYLIMDIGWQDPHRVYNVFFHLRLKDDGKIWIEEDWTEEGIVTELMNAGVPGTDIEMGYQPPEMRPYLDYKRWKLVDVHE
ncbi:MAG: XisI protein [Chloroflexaceae bacterium]|nr:XisI protein [Chloroflexaceae bacterium]